MSTLARYPGPPDPCCSNALKARFAPVLETRRTYLARMLARRDLEAREHALIDARMLPALGFWVIAARKAASDVRDREA